MAGAKNFYFYFDKSVKPDLEHLQKLTLESLIIIISKHKYLSKILDMSLEGQKVSEYDWKNSPKWKHEIFCDYQTNLRQFAKMDVDLTNGGGIHIHQYTGLV